MPNEHRMKAVGELPILFLDWARIGVRAVLLAITVAGPVSVLAMLIWARDRGFDLTDESMYLLSAQHPEAIHLSATLSYVYLAPLFRLAAENIAVFRVMGYGLVVLAAIALWFGIQQAVPCRKYTIFEGVGGYFVILAGSLLYYVWFLPTPSYNLLNAVAVSGFAGALFAGLGWAVSGRRRHALAAGLLAGAILGFDAFIKLPTAASLTALAILAVLLWPSLSLRLRSNGLISGLCGLLLWFVFHFSVLQPATLVWAVMHAGVGYAHSLDPRYTVFSMITRSVSDSWLLVVHAVNRYAIIFSVAIVASILVAILPMTQIRREQWLHFILPLSVLIAVVIAVRMDWYVAGAAYILKVAPLAGGALLLAIGWRLFKEWVESRDLLQTTSQTRRAELLTVLLLIALPLADAVGTSNPLAINVVMCLGPWSAAVWILTSSASIDGARPWSGWILPTFLSTLFSCQVAYGCLHDPYRLTGGLRGQTARVLIGKPASAIYVDPKTAEFVSSLQLAASRCHIQVDSPILAFYDLPGVVYSIGGVSPIIPWYIGHYPGTVSAMEKVMAMIPSHALTQSAIVLRNPLPSPLPNLAAYGLRFPSAYHECDELTIPSGSPTSSLSLWVPK